MVWCLTLEEITFDLENRSMEMQTKLLKACKYYPNLSGDESIIYKAIDDQKTHYSVLVILNRNYCRTFNKALLLNCSPSLTVHLKRE
jgi:hypothetical protein